MTSIYDKLKQLQYGEEYPFHMPGHKRNLKIDPLLDEIAKVDITEITGCFCGVDWSLIAFCI